MLNKNFKESLKSHCLSLVQEQIDKISSSIQSQQKAANNETKSSAGDKYETGRAMAHLEIDKLNKQLQIHQKNLALLMSQTPLESKTVAAGSLVQTSSGLFYITVSLGALKFNGQDVFVVSPVAPVIQLLLGKKQGDTIKFNNKPIEVKSII